MNYDAEVAVVGVGTVGSMALWRLARSGVSAHGFEQFGIAHDRSAAGGDTRMFRNTSLKDPDPLWVPLSLAALDLWRELETETGYSLLTLKGELMIGPDSAPLIVTFLRNLDQFDLDHEVLDNAALKRRYPQHRVDSGDCGVLDKNAGFLHAPLAILAAARRAESLGAVIHSYTQVREVRPEADAVVVCTEERTYRFEKAVIAGGPWTDQLMPGLRGKIQVRRPVQAWFAVEDPREYTAERFPVFVRTGAEFCYGFPSIDGTMMKLGVSTKYSELVPDPDELNRTVGLDEVAHFSGIARKFLSGVHPDPIRLGAYMEGYTVDYRPIVGVAPENHRVVVLGGFSGLGFKIAPILGEVAAQLATYGKPLLNVEAFALDRPLGDWPE